MAVRLILWLTLLACGGGVYADNPTVDFNRDIRPILSAKCFACHGPDEEHREAGLRLDERDPATTPAESGAIAIVPGNPDASQLLQRVTATDESVRMPPMGKDVPLTSAEVDKLRRWIAAGASYAKHWSLVPPVRPELPYVDRGWLDSPLDAFVLEKLQAASLSPAAAGDRYQLLRRLSLDLTGLPPTIEESESFVHDPMPDAHERVVDRALASPAYGERWARVWLDLARYADSTGYASDPLRPTIWRYRDWLVGALNDNRPFDQFTIEQVAGDLLPQPTGDQLLATAFHRNTMTNTEGGTDDEEWRVAAVKDRAATTVQVWMGLTLGCAQCHNHKYDPLSQKEFYQVYAFFNQSADSDKNDDQPLALIPTNDMAEQIATIDAKIAALRDSMNVSNEELIREQTAWEKSLLPHQGWTTLEASTFTAQGGSTLTKLDDGSLLASGTPSVGETYTVVGTLPFGGATAFRLEALPDPSLPSNGPGRDGGGNFVLSKISLRTAEAERENSPRTGQYLRIELPGKSQILSLAEVEVISAGMNIAKGKKATQVSTAFEGDSARAVDGNTDGEYYASNSVTHTAQQDDPWWEVDLGAPMPIERVVVWNRTDGGVGVRLAGAKVRILSADRSTVWEERVGPSPEARSEFGVTGWSNATIAQATASFTQKGYAVMNAVAQPDLKENGWAIAPRYAQSHTAWFTLASATPGNGPTRFQFQLEHHSSNASSTLGRFRLSVTNDVRALERSKVPLPILEIVDKSAAERSAVEVDALAGHYRTIAPRLAPIRDKIAALEKSKPVGPTVPVMRELPESDRRSTHLMVKGNFLQPGDVVEPGSPASLHPWPNDAPMNRLGLARWLMDPANPLTARVAMNRLWARVFGRGLVETEEDFGVQGDWPTHPKLLDLLAVEFMDRDWNVKEMLRYMVTSSTYRQTTRVTPELMEKDPTNRYLSRAPRLRLDAETVRDQSLALSGLLSSKMLGPSVFPYQPPGLWQAAFNGSDRNWATSPGEDKFRRGLYTFWRRTTPYPSMSAFDAPSREVCTLRRANTNTPLQALVTLNDPVYVEAAQALGRRLAYEAGPVTEDRVRLGLRLVLARPAEEASVRRLVQLYEDQLGLLRSDYKKTLQLATEPIGPLPPGMEPAEGAALSVLGGVLLNLDGVLTKG